jgi:hypothetical protein
MLTIDRVIGRRGPLEKIYFLNRPLHLTADGKAVEETDPAGVKVLGGAGSPISEADKQKYGLDESHLIAGEDTSAPAEAASEEPAPVDDSLPNDFPGHAALSEAGITTYAQLAAIEDVQAIPGIGPATAEKIAEAFNH